MESDLIKPHKSFFYKETNLGIISECPYHFECGMDIICTQGSGVLSTGVQHYKMRANDELIFPAGTILQLMEATADFNVRIFTFPKKMFTEVVRKEDTSYFEILHKTPLHHHPIGADSWTNVNLWMDFANMLCKEKHNQFIGELERNFLRSFYLWVCNIIPSEYFFTGDSYNKRQQQYLHFLSLIRENSKKQHEVSFYANELGISNRYLNDIISEYGHQKSPKQLIDEQLIAELKSLLRFTDLPVSEIAEKLKFPDQSYLSRYFKKHTGVSPRKFKKFKTETEE